jgi:hypothetical protein
MASGMTCIAFNTFGCLTQLASSGETGRQKSGWNTAGPFGKLVEEANMNKRHSKNSRERDGKLPSRI